MNRRKFTQAIFGGLLLSSILKPAGCNKSNVERCIHWYNLNDKIPQILLAGKFTDSSDIFYSRMDKGNFSIGLPELVIFTSEISIGKRFKEFYPFTQKQLEWLRAHITMIQSLQKVDSIKNVELTFDRITAKLNNQTTNNGIIYTFHKHNFKPLPKVIELGQAHNLKELIIIKDPTVPPYLCDIKE